VPSLCEFYPGICLTTEEKHGKTSVRVRKTSVRLRKTSVKVLYTYYQKHPHITKPSQTHTLKNPLIHTHAHTHTLQNNIKPLQYKLPKNTWRRTVLEEAKVMKKTWAEIKYDAKNRVRWRIFVDALCSAAE
jgi:hypothetical protein